MSGSAYIDHYTKIIAFWTPKCACTPVDHWFARGVLKKNPQYADKIESILEKIDYCDEGSPRLFLGANGFKHSFTSALQYDKYFIVHFTRHPALRIVSAFLNKFVIYNSRYLGTYEALEPFAKPVVQAIYARNGWDLSRYRGIRFHDFLEYLLSAVPGTVDGHWDTQIPHGIVRSVNLKPNYIVHAERFNEDLNVLNQHLDIDFVPPIFNATLFDGATESHENLTHCFSKELIESRICVRPGNLLDLPSVQKIKEIYAVDYKYFGYMPDNMVIPSGVEIRGNG